MDDLRDIGDLELYIAQSMVINVFLSHGYFKSRNCLREVQATVETWKPFMITHEIDTSKGGGSLNEMKVELGDTRLCDVIFSKERRITTWYRIADFQLVSIKQIAEFTLLQTPKYKDREKLDIIVPGELLRQPLGFAEPVVVYSSPNNPGARALATELEKAYHHGIKATATLPRNLHKTRELGDVRPTHFLLYLNVDTFNGEAGIQLANELRIARAAGLPVVMAHENDPERGGCEFSRFFRTTPEDLINGGLYKALALEFYPGPNHRPVSMAQVAMALATLPPAGGSFSALSRSTVRSVSRLQKSRLACTLLCKQLPRLRFLRARQAQNAVLVVAPPQDEMAV